MAVITPVQMSSGPAAPTLAAASGGGDTLATGNATNCKLIVTNGSGSTVTVTLTGVVNCSQGSTHNTTQTVAAGATEYIPVPAACINPSNGNVAVGYSSATSVTVGAITG